MTNEQTSLLVQNMEQAWRLFVREGVIADNVVKPGIARSWRRCYKQKKPGITISDRELQQRQMKNRVLIDISKPVIKDLVNIHNLNMQSFSVMLMDSDGVVNYRINYGNNIASLGHHCNETHCGTSGPALALADGVGTEVSGYEHIRPKAHKWHTIGVPIHDGSHRVVGALALLNTTGQCRPFTMQTVSLAAYLIEARLLQQQFLMNVSSSIMDGMSQAAILVNEDGTVISANKAFLHLFQASPDNLIGNTLTNSLDSQASYYFSTYLEQESPFYLPIKNLGGRNDSKQIFRIDRRPIELEYNNVLFMFTFEVANRHLAKQMPEKKDAFADLIGHNQDFLRVLDYARKAARLNSNVLIEGESGTGKEMIANAIHQESGRKGRFIAINCGAIPSELLNSELFGYEDGAFTGARKGGNPGKIELAHGGSLFLDEIGEMPLPMQVSLLRVLEDKTVTRIGGKDSRKYDVRIIAATNRDLWQEVKRGNFREDLFYRLNVVNIKLQPLRERKDDIPLLAEYLLRKCCSQNNLGKVEFEQDVIDALSDYDWPGNIRQLQNVIESSLVLATEGLITTDMLPYYIIERNSTVEKFRSAKLYEIEQAVIKEILSRNNGNISQSARELGITRKTLYNKIKQIEGM
jgi:transcriptional regulator with PAS, ATPase and Fis domain